MEPFSIISLVFEVHTAVGLLRKFYETVQNAPEGLAVVVSQTSVFERELDRLNSIRHRLPEDKKAYLDSQINTHECQSTIEGLKKLVDRIRPNWEEYCQQAEADGTKKAMKFKEKFNWMWKKDDIQSLVEKLTRQADRVRDAMMVTVLDYVVMIKDDTAVMKDLAETFSRLNTKSVHVDSSGVFSPFSVDGITWHGQYRYKPGQSNKIPYFKAREELASAQYLGQWETAMTLLEHGRKTHHQKWANCWRILPYDSPKKPSGYTALHQAAYHGAPKELVSKLIDSGGWRLARTLRDGSAKEYSTPLEIAQRHGWTHLYDILNPVIKRPLHWKRLDLLEKKLHHLIQDYFGKEPEAGLDCFILPSLEILTEYDHSRLWFPLQPELLDTREGRAVHIVLDNDELVVALLWGRKKRDLFRLSTRPRESIENAIVLPY